MSLSFSGYEVTTADTVAEGWSKASTSAFDILLLDVNLPDGSGLDLCRRLRETGRDVPILFLSARTDEAVVVEGMNLGAEDYIRKPFGTEELKVRMNKALRKASPIKNVIEYGPLVLNVDQRLATVNNQELRLGKREFDILVILTKRAGDVVTRENILSLLESNSEVYDRTIDSHLSHLRKKLRELVQDEVQILPVYGVGYRLQKTSKVP
jgi:DNA-binding response OmpR family regulator